MLIIVFFLLSFFSCLVCLVTKFLPCVPTCAESLLALVVLDSVALSFWFSARNTQRCMFLQELSTLGEHQYNALKSRAYHPTQHLRARGCLAIAATGVKVPVLYQVIEPLDSSLPGRLLAAAASSWPSGFICSRKILSLPPPQQPYRSVDRLFTELL
jgi:hypothetical protein